mmetsp:Transcript_19029/g.52536  ORF Transcript_19029/g.52536 Transcript_19029/m.52536 type:complete len:98 (-) Transcript_19029:410-703(-)
MKIGVVRYRTLAMIVHSPHAYADGYTLPAQPPAKATTTSMYNKAHNGWQLAPTFEQQALPSRSLESSVASHTPVEEDLGLLLKQRNGLTQYSGLMAL